MTVSAGSVTVPGQSTSMRHSGDLIKQGIYEISTTQNAPLGTRLELTDGRVFRYARNGAVALTACQMNTGGALIASHMKMAVTAATTVGTMSIGLTNGGASAFVANQYAEGFLNIDNGGGGYTLYKIKGHPAGAISVNTAFSLFDPVVVALTTSMYGTVNRNPWAETVVAATTIVNVPCGVNSVAVTASSAFGSAAAVYYYYWAQTWGPCSCLMGAGTPALGTALMCSAATPGSLIAYVVGTTVAPVAWAMRVEAAADYALVFLTICP